MPWPPSFSELFAELFVQDLGGPIRALGSGIRGRAAAMYGILHRREERSGGDRQERLMLPAVDATGKLVRLIYVTRMLHRELRGAASFT